MSVEQPFSALHAQCLFLLTDGRRDALARLDEGLGAREPFVLVTGEAGTGKTTLVLEAIARWGGRVAAASVTNPALTRVELIEEIARRFGSDPPAGASKPQLLACLDGMLTEIAGRDQIALLVIDDAHDLEPELLDELRLVANAQAQSGRRFEVILVGLPALDAKLEHPDLEAVRQRVAVHCRVSALSQRETRLYLHHRVNAVGGEGPRLFPRKACSEIHSLTGGVPRSINALASEALRRARESGASAVTSDHLRAAAAVVRVAVPVAPVAADPAATTTDTVAEDETAAPEAADRDDAATTREAADRPEKPRQAAKPSRPPADGTADAAPVDAHPAPETENRREKPTRAADSSRPAENGAANAMPIDAPAQPEARSQDSGAPETTIESNDPRAREWVRRFIGDEGPPRIGARIGWDASALGYSAEVADPSAVDESELETLFEPVRQVEAPPPSPPKPARERPATGAKSKKHRKPAPSRPAPVEVAPAKREPVEVAAIEPPTAPNAHATQTWGPLHTAAVVLMVLAALAVLILPRANQLLSRPNATPSAADSTSSKDDAAITPSVPAVELGAADTSGGDPATATTDGGTSSTTAEPTVASPSTELVETAESERFALDVATFIDRGRATDESDRLAELADLSGSVISGDGGYHILLGWFSTKRRAEKAANALLERGILWQARVVALPAGSNRN